MFTRPAQLRIAPHAVKKFRARSRLLHLKSGRNAIPKTTTGQGTLKPQDLNRIGGSRLQDHLYENAPDLLAILYFWQKSPRGGREPCHRT